jgi:hypothetical protein
MYGSLAAFCLFLFLLIPGLEEQASPPQAVETGKIRPKEETHRRFTAADYKRHVDALKKKIKGKSFHIVIQRPFIVIGDESPAWVRRRAEKTVKWAVDQLKKHYFEKDPNRIIDIWLFKDRESYYKHARELFGDEPDTPYGYFSDRDCALVMDISTGGGTLIHEIVHPFIAANFPDCPAWFNEGLASLYEQCAERNGRIVGLTNWRLKGLKAAIREGRVPSFERLCGTTTREFYEEDPGTHYSQARYLCYYLQEKGLLLKYFQAFRRSAADDPTGYQTLKKILGEEDMAAFKKKWESYVFALRFE